MSKMKSTKKLKEIQKEGYVAAACVLCGEIWWLPKETAKQYGAGRPYECVYCRNMLRNIYGRCVE